MVNYKITFVLQFFYTDFSSMQKPSFSFLNTLSRKISIDHNENHWNCVSDNCQCQNFAKNSIYSSVFSKH